MVSKTKTGIEPFDERFGGTYQRRVSLISGSAKSGKTAIALQFINAGIENDENVLMLSAMPSRDLAILAESLNIDVDPHVESGALTILEYNDYIPGRDDEENIMLPPQCFSQLQAVIESNGINRIAIDTIVPWITFSGKEHLAEHVFSFVRAFERLGVTTLFTCPKPVSSAAQRILKYVVDNVPVAINLMIEPDTKIARWKTVKYLGETHVDHSFRYEIAQGKGVIPYVENRAEPLEKVDLSANSPQIPAAPPARQEPQRKPEEKNVSSFFSANYQFSDEEAPNRNAADKSDENEKGPSVNAFSNVVWNGDSPD